ncbi:glycosyltransferase family 4 protein [Waterburya agarophytonicola K14]|uniref:Glycosyltransferase family 4 protein n=1 Tax=Waterburya agarophytonicola KI4 TaxID=2874699 RepID=A0A964BRB2_9CYAN|nr:glycosyltransferase family 4 protein [Waterburya agarophytonicola]MCC0177426.1 glycosyltransferase family 4 protein [Waterburya agarophytonicola KI4]
MKITLVTPSLFCGGAERVVVSLAEGFQLQGHQVTVITGTEKDTDFYQLPPGVKRIALGIMGVSKNPLDAIKSNLQRVSALRKAIKLSEPDIVMAHLTETNILTVLATLKTKYPVLITEHCDPNLISYGKFWETLRRFVYPFATKLVSVSQGVEDYFTWLPKSKKEVVYNPFFVSKNASSEIEIPTGVHSDRKWIMSMGRLTNQKGFDILLKAFAKVAPRYPDWQLIILGEGELRRELEELKAELNLGEQVVLPGRVKNPFLLMERAQFFVMSSRFEGFPMAHGEAMLCGLPVIATDCPSGPRELVRDGVDGILIPNQDEVALTKAIERLITNPEEREHFAKSAPEVGTRFSLEKIIQGWTDLSQKAILEKHGRGGK